MQGEQGPNLNVGVMCVKYSPQDKMLAVASSDDTIANLHYRITTM